MMRFTTAERMARIDRIAIEDHDIAEPALMETAGQMTARHTRKHFLNSDHSQHVCVICGKGHNGADGLVAARWLDQWGYDASVCIVDPIDDCSELTQQQYSSVVQNSRIQVDDDVDSICQADVYIDAMLGTGLSGDPRPPYDNVINQLNKRPEPVVCLDIPSGLSGDDPVPYDPCVHGNLTVTFGLPKLGMLLEPGYTITGPVVAQELCFPQEAYREEAGEYHLISASDMRPHLKHRRLTDHKGVAGRLGVIAGSERFPGASFLVGSSAYTVGAGLVSLIGPEQIHYQQDSENQDIIFTIDQQTMIEQSPEAFLDQQEELEAFVIGPGLDKTDTKAEWLGQIIPELSIPAVIDADGLNNCADRPELFRDTSGLVLTPHPGEASRLLDKPVGAIMEDPIEHVMELVDVTEQTVVLKGSRPVIGHPDGSISVNVTGTPALAKAGSGDVLSGMIGGFLTQGIEPGPAACLGTYLHGAAGRAASRSMPTTAVRSNDIVDHIPEAIEEFESSGYPDWYPVKFESHSLDTLTWNPF